VTSSENPQTIADDIVVSLDYTLTVDGAIVDASEGDPIEFIQGRRQIIAGLEQAIYGMAVSESKNVVVAPEDGYGISDPEAVIVVPRDEFPPEIPMEVGVRLQVQNDDGSVMTAAINKIEGDSVTLDFNHPLAGKTLHFNVTVAGLRAATEEELEHGHVHGDGGEYEEEFEDEYEEIEFDEEDDEEEA
jgi:FKBP-type peptidyl-prolyl cis-trans isomerase SlyD